jgi:hypothetical protein
MIAATAGLAVALVILWIVATVVSKQAQHAARELRVEVDRRSGRHHEDDGRDAATGQ